MLVLTRNQGTAIYGGFGLTEVLEGTFEHKIEIVELGEQYGSFIANGLKINRVEKKGSVDNKALYKDLNVEALLAEKGKTVDDYRKEPVVSYVVSSVEE